VLRDKLQHLGEGSAARAPHAGRYNDAFQRNPSICPPRVDPANESIFNQYTLRVPRRDELQAHLKARGIGNAVYYPLALHLQPCFAHLGYARGSLPVSEEATQAVISLPVYPEMTLAQQDAVIDAVLEFHA
jgi:dTDP-4-amino-4,6-dideoxygalactose transaminase